MAARRATRRSAPLATAASRIYGSVITSEELHPHAAGRPNHEGVVELIAATTSKTGLRVHAQRDHGVYPTNVQSPEASMAAIGLVPHDFHGDWNYTLDPIPVTGVIIEWLVTEA